MRRTKPDQLWVFVCCLAALLLAALPGGCSFVSPDSEAKEKLFSRDELSAPYNQITLVTSLTIDALPTIQRFQSDRGPLLGGAEVLSEGQNTVATSGQSKDGLRTWLNMVAFHEFRLNVIRKYFFIVDEGRTLLGIRSGRGMSFDCQTVLGKEVLETSYMSENTRRIAILRHVLENLRVDIKTLGVDTDSPNQDNKMLSVCGMLINQTLELISIKLDSSPVLALRLESIDGIDFDHISFGKGKIRMVIQNDMAAVSFQFGDFVNAKGRPQ